MKPNPPPPELRRLVDRLHDGSPLSRVEMARLEELLVDDDALSYYLEVSRKKRCFQTSLSSSYQVSPTPDLTTPPHACIGRCDTPVA